MSTIEIPDYPDYVVVEDEIGPVYYSRIDVDGKMVAFSYGSPIDEMTPEMLDDIRYVHRTRD